ncbi:MAG: prepilin-type N-terminal cleavage/methylation domain-containing protein [Phycisphaeraceae bacterium]|nr:prepilin-type N-terminal cleavage/methylation domain-containing protein [Phycisphaeraceae bacterium]
MTRHIDRTRAGQRSLRRGFSLLEAVVVVVVLGLVVPSSVSMMQRTSEARIDAVGIMRATFLAEGVLETIVADMASPHPGLGFDALDDIVTYLEAPEIGLRTRLADFVAPYAGAGLSYEVSVSPRTAWDGDISPDIARNQFRTITVTVRFPLAMQSSQTLTMSTVVSALP